MDEFEIDVGTHELTFCAAHFVTYGDAGAEPLHGHNYRLRVALEGELDENGMVHDFLDVREHAGALADRLDHRVLLPGSSPVVELRREDGAVTARRASDGAEYRFPEEDCVVLPVRNTTAELVAGWAADELEGRLRRADPRLRSLRVEIEEEPGQSAACERGLSG